MARKVISRFFNCFVRFNPLLAAVLTMIAVLSSVDLFAADRRPLSGNVTGVLDGGEYLVKSVLSVPAGDTLRIGAGAEMYFEQLTGIDVRGVLKVIGAPGYPVVMTSANDTAGASAAAQPFDWNGIMVFGPNAAVFMRNASVSNSVYGVNADDTLSKAELRDVVFKNNGYAPLVRAGETVPVTADTLVSVAWNTDEPPPGKKAKKVKAVNTDNTDKAGKADKTDKAKRRIDVKFIANMSALTVAVAGLTTCYIGLSNTNTYYKHYIPEGNTGMFSEYYEGKINKNITVSAVGAIAAGAGLGYMGLTLFF